MRIIIAALAVAASATAFFDLASPAQSAAVRQAGRVNVYASVQAGRRPSSVEVEQQGRFNVLGVVQANPGASLSAFQRGGSNVAIVRQSGAPLARGHMP